MTYTEAIKQWLLSCPEIKGDRLYFNYLSVGAEKQCFQTVEHTTVTEDIVGNEIGKIEFAIIDFRPLTKHTVNVSCADLERFVDVEKINQWMRAQRAARRFPIFEGATVEKMTVAPSPTYSGMDSSEHMALAKYMIQVTIEYIKYD